MLDPRRLKSIQSVGKYTENNNLIGLTQKVFMKDSDAQDLVNSGNFTTADVILSYNEATQKYKVYDHITQRFIPFGEANNYAITFVEEDSDLPSADGFYIFRSGRPADTVIKTAALSIGSDSDSVKGSIFQKQGATWRLHQDFIDAPPTVADNDGISYSKASNRFWSTLLQRTGNFKEVVATLSDLTDTLRNESPGWVFVEAEQETYFWSAAHDQTVDNGWAKFYPKNVDTLTEYQALQPGERFTVRQDITGLPNLVKYETQAQWFPSWTGARPNWNYSDTNTYNSATSVTETWAGKGGKNGDTGDVVFEVTSNNVYSSSYALNRMFRSDGSDWVCNPSYNSGLFNFTSTGADCYMSGFRFYPQRSSPGAGFRSVSVRIEYKDGHAEWDAQSMGDGGNAEYAYNTTYFDSPVDKINIQVYDEWGADGGVKYFSMGFPYQKEITTNVLPKGSYIKTGPNDSDYKEVFPINISTGTRFIKSYDNTAAMIAGRTVDEHFEGGIYRINTATGTAIYYEYNVAFGDTPTGTINDYNLISAKTQNFSYPSEASLLADYAVQTPNQWYYADQAMYLYNGGSTGTLADYTKVGGIAAADKDLSAQYRNQIFRPEDNTLHYDHIGAAADDGYLTVGPNPTGFNLWNEAYINRSDYWDVKIPANTANLWIRMICDSRNSNVTARYIDGNKEWIGGFGQGQRAGNAIPGPFGRNTAFSRSYYHRWFTIPVSKVPRERTVRIYRNSADDSYLSGISFGSTNYWDYTFVSPIEMNRRYFWSISNADQTPGYAQWTPEGYTYNSANNAGGELAVHEANRSRSVYIPITHTEDQVLYINKHEGTSSNDWADLHFKIEINGKSIDSDITVGIFERSSDGSTSKWSDAMRTMTQGWDNPLAKLYSTLKEDAFYGVRIPAKYLTINTDSDGYAVPTPQFVKFTNGVSTDLVYIRGCGFIKYKTDEDNSGVQIISQDVKTTVGVDSDWAIGNFLTGSTVSSTINSTQTVDSYSTVDYEAVKWIVVCEKSGERHTAEILATHNATDAFSVEYANFKTGASDLMTLNVVKSGTNIQLRVTPANVNTNVKVTQIRV